MQPESDSENIQPVTPDEGKSENEHKTDFLVDFQDFNSLFTDIGRFNSQFSMGSLMFSNIRNQIKENEDETVRTDEKTQQLTASGIGLIHEDILKRTGLDIEPVSGKAGVLIGFEGKTGVGEMRINIGNRENFVNFLNKVNPKETKSSEFGNNLKKLSEILAQQIYDHYDLENPSDEALHLLSSLDKIIGEYKRLGVPVERLESYLVHARQGDLREFIQIEKKSLLAEPGKSFGPADWQKDASPDFLRSRWNDAIETLRKVRENPNAQDLYNQLFDNLNRSLKLAEEDVDTPGKDQAHQEYKDKLKPILEETRQRFG
jgi:hypothetical protein